MIKIVQLDGPLKNLSHATKQLISPYSITTHYLYEITYSRLLRNYKLVKHLWNLFLTIFNFFFFCQGDNGMLKLSVVGFEDTFEISPSIINQVRFGFIGSRFMRPRGSISQIKVRQEGLAISGQEFLPSL